MTKPVGLNHPKLAFNQGLPEPCDEDKNRLQRTTATRSRPRTVDGGHPPIDPAALTETVGDDPAMHDRLMRKFIETTPDIIGEIHAAYARRQAGRTGHLAHKIKASARAVGANELADLCQALEQAGKTQSWERIDALEPRLDVLMAAIVHHVISRD